MNTNNEIKKIFIIPARFIKKHDDGKYLIRCLIENNIFEDRIFDKYSLRGIKNPKYLLIGIIIGVGFEQINFCDATEFEKIFKKKYNVLLK